MIDGMSPALNSAAGGLSSLSSKMTTLGTQMTVGLTAPLVALGALAAKTAIDFETAFTGVAKTVGGTTEELAKLRDELESLATSAASPVSSLENAHIELFKIAEAAGQLGVAKEDIVAFTDVMGQLAMSTDVAGEEGAQMIARFANVADMPLSEIRQFGDAITTLGNNSAATEKEILSMSLRLASIADLGFETDEILAYSTALSSLGITAELGGTNFMKGMNEIAKAVALGGNELTNFADVAGMTSAEFSKAWKEDASGAFQAFINGLGEMNADERIIELEKLGLTGSEMQRVFLSLAGSTDMLTDTLNQSSEAFAGNGALMAEASKFAETTAGRINRAKNMFNQVMNDFGELLLPLIVDFLEKGVIPLLTWINSLDDSTRQWILGLLAVVAAIGPIMTAIGGLISAFQMIAGIAPVIMGGLAAIAAAFSIPLVALGAFVAAVAFAVAAILGNWFGLRDALVGSVGAIVNAVSQVGDAFKGVGSMVMQGWENIFHSVGTTLSQIGQLIMASLSKLGSIGFEIGKNIIFGLIKGFSHAMIEFIRIVQEKVNEINQKIRNAFGIASPSKVMMDIGENVVAGFHKGIENMGGIGVSVPSTGGSIQSRQPSLAIAGASGGGGSGSVFNIYTSAGTTDQQAKEIARKVDKILGQQGERRGAKKIR
jgi:TP901 family phage tail tape measure protein